MSEITSLKPADPCGNLPLEKVIVDWSKQSVWIEHGGPTPVPFTRINIGSETVMISCLKNAQGSPFTLNQEKIRLTCEQKIQN